MNYNRYKMIRLIVLQYSTYTSTCEWMKMTDTVDDYTCTYVFLILL